MDETNEERLYGLIEIAERQQAAAQTVLEGMAAERIALRQRQEQWMSEIGLLKDHIRSAVLQAVSESMSGAADIGAEAIKGAVTPLPGLLTGVLAQAQKIDTALQNAVRWTTWRLLGWTLATAAGLALLWWLASAAMLWADTSAIGKAQMRKAELHAEIAELEARRDAWINAGAPAKLDRCGSKGRLCVRVDDKAGSFGIRGDYRVIWGH